MFPKAQIKRFNDNIGCAPPPGAYDPRSTDRAHGAVVDKSERFREPKVSDSNSSVNVSTVGSAKTTPVKQLFAAPQAIKSGTRKQKPTPTNESAKIRELEQQLKSLCKEKSEKERQLCQKEEELRKLDGKLHNVQTDRSSLHAKLAAAQKQLLEVKKANNLLKTKETSSEVASKKCDDLHSEISSLKQQLAHKEVEMSRLRKDQDAVVAALLASVQMLETVTAALEEHVQTLGEPKGDTKKAACADKNKKHKTTDDFTVKLKEEKSTDMKIKMVKKKTQELHQRFSEALKEVQSRCKTSETRYQHVTEEHQRLKEAADQMKTELQQAIEARQSLEEQRDNLLGKNTSLNDQIQTLSAEHSSALENHKLSTLKVAELQETKAALEARFEDLQKLHETVELELKQKMKTFEDKEMVVSETTSQMHERLVELQAENEDFVGTLKETGELLSRTKDENMKLEEMLQEVQEKWAAEKKELLVRMETLSVEKSQAEEELSNASKKVELLSYDLEQHKTASDSKINELNTQLENEKTELIQLQNKLGDLVYEKSQLHNEIGHLEAQLKLVKCEAEKMKTEAEKALEVVPGLKERIEVLNHAKAESEERAEDLQEQNCSLQKTLELFQVDVDGYTASMEQEKVDAQRQIVSLTEEVEGLREQKDQMARELDDWLTDKSELDIEIAKLQCRIKVLEMESSQVKEESDAVLREEKAGLEKVKAEKQQMERDMEQYGIDLLSHAAQIQSLQEQVNSKTTECEEAEKCSQGLKEELAKVSDSKAEVEQSLSELRDTYTSKCSNSEALAEDNLQLGDELKTRQDDCEDLECQLDQLRADFKKRCDERDELRETNAVKDRSLSILSQQVAQLGSELQVQQAAVQTKEAECDALTRCCEESEKARATCQQQASNYKQQIEDYKENLLLKCDECDDLRQRHDDLDVELTLSARELVDLQEKVESLHRYNKFLYDKLVSVTSVGHQLKERRQGPPSLERLCCTVEANELYAELQIREKQSQEERLQLVETYEAELSDLKLQQQQSSASAELEAELAKYKSMLEDLQAKVEPFMDQIDAFELEKQTLLGMNKNTQAEMDKLAGDYARLLGHQNQKQKIKHIVKIKEENNTLKVENMSLKTQVAKHKRTIQKLEEKDAPKRFDQSKAFKSTRENLNVTAVKSPLKEVNRK